MDNGKIFNIVIAGIGGQGVLKASDVLATAAFLKGFDVKKSEVHGMSQRGGSVTSDVRFGKKVWSPTVTRGEADAVIVLEIDQKPIVESYLKQDGIMLLPSDIAQEKLPDKRSINIAMLGRLSTVISCIEQNYWLEAIKKCFPEKLWEQNISAFQVGTDQKG